MDAPPPYYSAPPKKNKTGLIIGLVLGGVLFCCIGPLALLGGLGIYAFQKGKGVLTCSITFGNIQKSIVDYAHAHHDTLPDANTWQTDVKPYYVKEASQHRDESGLLPPMEADASWGCTLDSGSITGISFNSDLSKKKLSEIKDPANTVLISEIPTSSLNAHAPYTPQPPDKSPTIMGKHRGWYVAHVEGTIYVHTPGGDKNAPSDPSVDIQVNTHND